jgi:hypothetical protein
MRILCVILLVSLFALGWQLKMVIDTNRQQASEIQSLSAKLTDKATRERFDLQQKCASQAEQTFHRLGYREDQPTDDILSAIYQSHYSAERTKCFMTLESIGKGGFQSKLLFDAYENRPFAEYDWMPQKDKKFWEVPPVVCQLTPSSSDERACKSEDEYKAFVAGYME